MSAGEILLALKLLLEAQAGTPAERAYAIALATRAVAKAEGRA
jgi:hypothetical protein